MPPPAKRSRPGDDGDDTTRMAAAAAAGSAGRSQANQVQVAEALAALQSQSAGAGGMAGSLLRQAALAVARLVEQDPAGYVEALADVPSQYLAPVFKQLSYIALQKFVESGQFADALDSSTILGSMEETEDHFRKLFATQRNSPEIADPHVMLIKPHEHMASFEYNSGDVAEQETPKMFEEVSNFASRPKEGAAICSQADFLRNWDVFTMGQLKTLDWDNVFAAGGSVQACLEPYSDQLADPAKRDVRGLRKHFLGDGKFMPANPNFWRTSDDEIPKRATVLSSDVDLFIYGLNGEEATRKLQHIEAAIVDSNPHEMVVVRTPQSVTFVTQYPYRHIQVILRAYKSPAEVLMGFDLDSVTVGFDGTSVLALPRFHRAVTRGYNLVAQSRRSTTYESRLMKYAFRGFAVAVPKLDRAKVDLKILEVESKTLSGGARLYWLETKVQADKIEYWRVFVPGKEKVKPVNKFGWLPKDQHVDYVDVSNTGEAHLQRFSFGAAYLKPRVAEYEALTGKGAADYSSVFLPWSPRWNAGRISTWLSEKSLSDMYGADDQEGARTAFQYGSAVNDVLGANDDDFDDDEDDDGEKPSADLGERETDVVLKDTKLALKWLVTEPGRQFIGSFHPEEGDWYAQLYDHTQVGAIGKDKSNDTSAKECSIDDVSNDDSDDDGDNVVGNRPMCEYGSKCYRLNPQHISDFLHPPEHDPHLIAMQRADAKQNH